MSVPVYVAEAAPSDIRGRLVTINQLFITIGILVSSIVAGLFSVDKENGWRLDNTYVSYWRSSHNAVTHVLNKNSNIQGRSPNVVKVIFHTIRNCS